MAGKPGMNKSGHMGGTRKGAGRPSAPVGTFVMDCMPMMADVVSGTVARPEPIAGKNILAQLRRCPAWPRVIAVVGKRRGVRRIVNLNEFPIGIRMVHQLISEPNPVTILFGGSVLVAFNLDGTRAAVTDV